MDTLIDIILDLIINGSIELLPNKKIAKVVRIMISLILIGIMVGIIVLGVVLLKKQLIGGIVLLVVGVSLLVGSIFKIKKYFKN